MSADLRPMIGALILAAALAGCRQPAPPDVARTPPPAAADSTMTLFSFDAEAEPWTVQNDGVMGGNSKGTVAIDGGTLTFTGTLVTEGGGFTSVLADRDVDLSGYDGLELRARGDGRTYEVEVDDGTRDEGRQVSRRAPFETTSEWATVRVPWSAFETSVFGEPIDVAPLDPSAIQAFGLYIIDGQDGPFRLEVDWIRATHAGG